MFTSIVVPVDDGQSSERSVPVAGALAGLAGATLELISVDPEGPTAERTRSRLDALARRVPDGVAVSTTVDGTIGSVAGALANLDRDPGTLLCLATRGRGALLSLALGSVTSDLVRQTRMPVLVVGPRCATTDASDLVAPAVAALDGSDADDDVMAAAVGWCRATGAPLSVTTTITRPSGPEAWSDADRLLAWAEERAAAADLPMTTSLVAATVPDEGILRALDGAVGCLIVGSHRRGRLGQVVFGSTVTRLAQRASCPVLVAGTRTHGDLVSPMAFGTRPRPATSVR